MRFFLFLTILTTFLSLSLTVKADNKNRMLIATSGTTDITKNGEYVWVKAFMDNLKKFGLEVGFFPSSVLGKDDARTDMIQLGVLQMNITGTPEIYPYSPYYRQLKRPFLFEDAEHFSNFWTKSKFVESVNQDIASRNMFILGYASLGGMSGLFTTDQRVESLEDMTGLRIRGMSSLELSMINSWGLHGAQVAWEEVPQAMETGVVEGYLNPPLVPVMFGHTNQIKYFTDIGSHISMRIVVVAKDWYDGLSPPHRLAVDKSVIFAQEENMAWAKMMYKKEFEILHDAGVDIVGLTSEEREKIVQKTIKHFDNKGISLVSKEVQSWINQAKSRGTEK
ncbi:MAG: TRAP transporter substrate-binding protein DctP [Emcibacter sp.]|nr:TRAP transporter substrate-binding protein DctP [Emcibacter sp.]